MQKENNILGTLIILLSIVVLGYTAFIIYDKVLNKEEKTTVTSQIQIADVIGEYTSEFKGLKDQGGIDDSTGKLSLTLYSNGIFSYVYNNAYVPRGIMGNYIIKDKNIVLTAWFTTGSSPQLNIAKRTKTLTINADGSIMDSNIKVEELVSNLITSAELVKTKDINENYDISSRLEAACIDNSDGRCGSDLEETKF